MTNTTEQTQEITLDNLRPAKGATRNRLRVGRGRASGAGKTANRGHNGEGQRSGRSRKVGFEGGQMPAYRRLPKLRHFFRPHKMQWLELNVGDLAAVIPDNETEVTYELLVELGLLRNGMDGLRIIGNGEINRKLKVHAHYASPSAQEKLKAAGCELVLVAPQAE